MLKALKDKFDLETLQLVPEIEVPEEDDEPPEADFDMAGLNAGDFGINVDDLLDMDAGMPDNINDGADAAAEEL